MTNEESVKMNPLGPHFYVDDSRPFTFPEGWRDAVTDRMNHIIAEMDEEHGWPITHEHIEGHTEITTVQWEDDALENQEMGERFGFEIQPFDVTLDWYSREQVR